MTPPLGAVAADLHVAPLAPPAVGTVDEEQAAVLGAALTYFPVLQTEKSGERADAERHFASKGPGTPYKRRKPREYLGMGQADFAAWNRFYEVVFPDAFPEVGWGFVF